MSTLLLRGRSAVLPTVTPRPATRPAARPAAPAWMTPEIRRNLSQRALRLMRSGD